MTRIEAADSDAILGLYFIGLLVIAIVIVLIANHYTKKPRKRLPRPSAASTRYLKPGSL